MLVIASSCIALAQGCAHIERAANDPCADQTERRNNNSGVQIISCRLLRIPFRAEVLDTDTGMPIATAVALNCKNVLGEAADDGPLVSISADNGSIEGELDTFTDVSNPYTNECFRSTFRGILIEIRKDGYIPYRGYVPLPTAEGEVADLGVIQLIPLKESKV